MGKSRVLNISFEELLEFADVMSLNYKKANPFPHIYTDNLFSNDILMKVLQEFPDLNNETDVWHKNADEDQFVSQGSVRFGATTRKLVRFLNSRSFLEFLTRLTGIKGLTFDPYFWGSGFHQIKQGGFLNIHADFDKHPRLNLERRVALLLYLNQDWEKGYGGSLELWDNTMTGCQVELMPLFNRTVIFTTTDDAYHGLPDPLTCPENRSRKSLALYYYTSCPAEKTNRHGMAGLKDHPSGETTKPPNRFVSFLKTIIPSVNPGYKKSTKEG